mmetsp:Transcript_2713/g.8382  ORF Transcript_2713/g.8382 Transcript_2713/m.8382 type:complete len:119 (+) Transcript_2713:2540-2896(+)
MFSTTFAPQVSSGTKSFWMKAFAFFVADEAFLLMKIAVGTRQRFSLKPSPKKSATRTTTRKKSADDASACTLFVPFLFLDDDDDDVFFCGREGGGEEGDASMAFFLPRVERENEGKKF